MGRGSGNRTRPSAAGEVLAAGAGQVAPGEESQRLIDGFLEFAPDGFGGKRTAYLDEILFIPVPDVAVRLAGVETGEYHFGQQIQQDQYDRVKGMKGVDARVVKPQNWSTAVLNHKQGIMTDKRIRQAFQAALDMEPIMAAGFGHKDFYRLDAGIYFQEQLWHSKRNTRNVALPFGLQAAVKSAPTIINQREGFISEDPQWGNGWWDWGRCWQTQRRPPLPRHPPRPPRPPSRTTTSCTAASAAAASPASGAAPDSGRADRGSRPRAPPL